MKDVLDEIDKLKNKYLDKVISVRRNIHENPELGFCEFKTSELIVKELKEIGINDIERIADTGVVANIKSKNKGKTLAIRAEMDALPINEETNLDFKSKTKNVMHACGHDVHTANLLGVAYILNELKDEFNGNVKLIFQPAEETLAGAKKMIEEGVLENPKVDAIFGLHSVPEDVGYISYGYGIRTATTEFFEIIIKGKSSHSARPQDGVDAILIGANIISKVNMIVSKLDPFENATVTIGQASGGVASNIISEDFKIKGMIRTTKESTKDIIKEKIKSIVKCEVECLSVSGEVIFNSGYPSVINEKSFTDDFYNITKDYISLKDDKSIELVHKREPILAAEDFGFYSKEIPACYISVGGGNFAPQHNKKFMVDEKIFDITLDLTSFFAINYLRRAENGR